MKRKKKINIKKILLDSALTLKNRFYLVSGIGLVLIAVILSYIDTASFISKNPGLESIDKKEGDLVISPSAGGDSYEKPALGNYLNYKSYENVYYFENLFKSWSKIFDVFTSNSNYKLNILTDPNNPNSLSEQMVFTPPEFRVGSEDGLIDLYGGFIAEECTRYGLDWRLVLAMIRQESFFNSEAESHAGAYGLMQIMPGTGAGLQQELRLTDTRTPKNNLIAGIYYYAVLVASFDFTGEDKYKFALAAYNAGLGRVVDAMTIAAYMELDYTKWENVKEMYPYLSSKADSVQSEVWPDRKRPAYGTLDNWREPYNYVTSIMYYYDEYKKIYESNLKEKKSTKNKK